MTWQLDGPGCKLGFVPEWSSFDRTADRVETAFVEIVTNGCSDPLAAGVLGMLERAMTDGNHRDRCVVVQRYRPDDSLVVSRDTCRDRPGALVVGVHLEPGRQGEVMADVTYAHSKAGLERFTEIHGFCVSLDTTRMIIVPRTVVCS